jgi:hypothetical protein
LNHAEIVAVGIRQLHKVIVWVAQAAAKKKQSNGSSRVAYVITSGK